MPLVILLSLVACHGNSRPHRPPLNPSGSPWGPPPHPGGQSMLQTQYGPVTVVSQGYPVDLKAIQDELHLAAEVCGASQHAYHGAVIVIEEKPIPHNGSPTGWAGGVVEGGTIRVVGMYVSAGSGQTLGYLDYMQHEAEHLLGCRPSEY